MIFEDYWFYQLELGCITAGIEVGLFTFLDGKKLTVSEIATGLKLYQHALEPLLLNLTPMGFILKEGDLFSLTEESINLLSKKSDFYRGDFFVQNRKLHIDERLIQFLKTGSAPLIERGKSYSDMWEKGMIDQDTANGFTGNMHSLMKYAAFLNSKTDSFLSVNHLVDVGGGSGAWAIALTRQHPHLRVTIFDLPPVLKAAKNIVSKEHPELLERISFVPGNFFKDPLPDNADAFLLSNILHDWPVPQCQLLLHKISSSLKPGGKFFIHECILNEDKTSPKFSILFHLLMALNHGAQQFTKLELDELMSATGFGKTDLLLLNRNYSLLVAEKLK